MGVSRRAFIKSAGAAGLDLLARPSSAISQTYPDLFGISELRAHILRLEENKRIHPAIFWGNIGDKKVSVTTNGAMTIVDYITLETKIAFNENGCDLALDCTDQYIKGYLEFGPVTMDGIRLDLKKGDQIEALFSNGLNYIFTHYRRLRAGEEKPLGVEVHHIHRDFIQDGSAYFMADGHVPYLNGTYEPKQGDFWKFHEGLLRRRDVLFRYSQNVYRNTLQQVILELEKKGELQLSR